MLAPKPAETASGAAGSRPAVTVIKDQLWKQGKGAYDEVFGVPLRILLRTILTVVLLLGSGAGDWAPVAAHECCCGAVPAGVEDSCPCPKPESNRSSSRGVCSERQVVVATPAARRAEQARKRMEPRPEPQAWANVAVAVRTEPLSEVTGWGREPDLGRHLAQLNTFRI